jgi:hypothetical protein
VYYHTLPCSPEKEEERREGGREGGRSHGIITDIHKMKKEAGWKDG